MLVKWLRNALGNLESEADHIAEDNPQAAAELVVEMFKKVNQLSDFPNLGRPGRVPGTRELVITRYPFTIPYRVKDEVVEILRVFHPSRRWPRKF